MVKKFALFSVGVLCLMLSAFIGFYIGSGSAKAQAPDAVAGYRVYQHCAGCNSSEHFVMLSNGDVYHRYTNTNMTFDPRVDYLGNFWTGAPVPTSDQTWGGVKGQYDGKK